MRYFGTFWIPLPFSCDAFFELAWHESKLFGCRCFYIFRRSFMVHRVAVFASHWLQCIEMLGSRGQRFRLYRFGKGMLRRRSLLVFVVRCVSHVCVLRVDSSWGFHVAVASCWFGTFDRPQSDATVGHVAFGLPRRHLLVGIGGVDS